MTNGGYEAVMSDDIIEHRQIPKAKNNFFTHGPSLESRSHKHVLQGTYT